MMNQGIIGSDDEGQLDVSELPIEYRVKGFLRSACSDGHETLTRVLLDKGADVNYITSNTQLATALHVAVSCTRDRIVPVLLPQASAATIQAALQYAIQYQNRLSAIIKILQQQGGNNTDKDGDKNLVEKPTKSQAPQKETETQTPNPPQKENQTQTNGSDGEAHNQPPQQKLEQQLKEQQKQLQEQQQMLHVQQQKQEEAHKKVEQAQELASQAQRNAEEMKTRIQKQDELLESQERQVKKLTEQLQAQEVSTAKLTGQLEVQEEEAKRLAGLVSEQEVQVKHLKERIGELERDNKDLSAQLESYTAKGDATVAELQAQIVALQKDIESKAKKIEKVSQERDSERRAKEVAKRILSSNGPRDIPETLGHSHAIRMGSLQAPSPTPSFRFDDDDSPLTLPSSPTAASLPSFPSSPSSSVLRSSNPLLSRLNGVVLPTRADESKDKDKDKSDKDKEKDKGDTAGLLRKARTGSDMNLVASMPLTPPSQEANRKGPLSSKSRSRDDMDIATEADRARVRRLVARWEEIKHLEIPSKQ